MTWTFRTMVVSDAVVDTCRSLAMLLAGEGQVLWTTPLSPDGAEPATHWISSGLIEDTFAALLPLSEWTQAEDGAWVGHEVSSGDPAQLAELSDGAVTEEQVIGIFSQCDVTLDEPQASFARSGIQMVQPDA